jgi:hypothetical protein
MLFYYYYNNNNLDKYRTLPRRGEQRNKRGNENRKGTVIYITINSLEREEGEASNNYK